MNVLITGHRGFVGRHFCTALNDHSITGIDIKEGNDCRDFFKECQARFDLIIHLAAIVGGRQTIENDPLSVATDLSIDAEFFNWCVRTKQDGSIIYYSSSAAYPTKLQERPYRLKESDLDLSAISNPDMTYGWAKLTGEYLAKFAKENYGLRVYTFRPFSGYGADQDLSYPFPSFIQRAKAQLDPFEIWGDGTQVRDFIHINDIVAATLKAVEVDFPSTVNLCTGRPMNFNELARLMMRSAQYEAPLFHQLTEPVGVSFRCGDPTLLHQFYLPKISLEEGIRDALNA